MSYLQGNHIQITTPILKKALDKKCTYLLKRDIDARGTYYPRKGRIEEIFRKHVDFGNGEYMAFSQIAEIVIDP